MKALRRAVQLLPVAAFLATFGVFFVDKDREARTVLRSGRGLLVIAVLVAGYILLAVVVRRYARWTPVAPVVLTAAVLGLAAWTVRPYYVDETVNRSLVTEELPPATTGDPPPSSSSPGTSPPSTSVPAGPVRVSSGAIVGIDHDAAGTVSLVRTPDDRLIVRFEDFDIEGTPDPQLYLAQGDDVRDTAGIHLGPLPGNRGQVLDFEVPDAVDAGPGWTVLVWCGRFAVPIANATQVAA